MNKRREAAAILLAVLLFAGISHLLGQILMPVRKEYGSDWDHYLQEEQNSLDVLFFGSSLVYCDVIPAVIWRESKFNRHTIGKDGEVGLMQIRPETAVIDWARAKKRSIPSKGALMDPAGIIGVVLAFGAIFTALTLEGADPMSILLPAPLMVSLYIISTSAILKRIPRHYFNGYIVA